MRKANIKAVIFDMDGVLVDSEHVIEAAAVKALKEYGVEARPEDFIPFVGAGDDRYIGGVAEKYGLSYRKEMKERLYEIYLEILEDELGVFEGALPLLEILKKEGYILALASSADKIKVKANLKAAGIPAEYFSCVFTGEDVSEKKPSPEIYLKTAEKLAARPGECVVVEDALNGIESAKSAGMVSVGVAASFSAEELQKAGADYVCPDISGVFDIIKTVDINGGI